MARHIQIAATSNRRRGAAGAAPFVDPSSISGCLQFVEMDRGILPDPISDEDNITGWTDEWSGSDRDFTQATSSNQPEYDEDYFDPAGANFNGANDHLQAGNVSDMNFERTDDFYLIVAFKTPASFGTGFQVLYSKQINISPYAGWLLHNVDKTCRMQMRYNASNDVNVAGGTALSNDTFYIVEIKYTGASTPTGSAIEIFLNGSTESLTDNSAGTLDGTTQSIGEVMLGARGISGTSTTGYTTVIYAAAGCYNELPSDDDRTSLRTYLTDKYN